LQRMKLPHSLAKLSKGFSTNPFDQACLLELPATAPTIKSFQHSQRIL
jgi:hypothetical protein